MRIRFLTLVLLCSLPITTYADRALTVSGSTTILPVIKAARQVPALRQLGHIGVRGGGSLVGLQELAAGAVDMAMVSMELPAEYADRFQVYRIGYDGVVLIVHADNPVMALEQQQVQEIYRGNRLNWHDVTGVDAPIKLLAKTPGHSTRLIFDRFFQVDSGGHAGIMVGSNAEMIVMVATNTNALGYVSLGSVGQAQRLGVPVRALVLQNAVPTSRAVTSANRAMRRPLNLVVRNGESNASVKQLVQFMRGREGQALVRDAGFMSVLE